MSLINREALYEKVCGLEAQALSYIEKIIHDEDKVEEWKIWSAILTERTAFKHDIFDAPEVKPERNPGQWIPCSERLPEQPNPNPELEGKPLDIYLVCKQDNIPFRAFWNGRNFADGWTSLDVDAWMPLPEPYQAERRTDDRNL